MVDSLYNLELSEIYALVNFWKIGLGLSPEQMAQIAYQVTGKNDPNTYTVPDWLNIRYHLSSLLP